MINADKINFESGFKNTNKIKIRQILKNDEGSAIYRESTLY